MSGPVNHTKVPLREFMELRFDALEAKFDTYCTLAETRHQDHEDRLRTLQGRNVLGHIIHGTVEFGAIVLAAMGLRQP